MKVKFLDPADSVETGTRHTYGEHLILDGSEIYGGSFGQLFVSNQDRIKLTIDDTYALLLNAAVITYEQAGITYDDVDYRYDGAGIDQDYGPKLEFIDL